MFPFNAHSQSYPFFVRKSCLYNCSHVYHPITTTTIFLKDNNFTMFLKSLRIHFFLFPRLSVLRNTKKLLRIRRKKLIGARQKTSTPFPLDLKQEKVNLFRPKKSILLKISHSLLTFSRHVLFSIALTSRVRKRLLVKEQPSK